jgi:hypothetical protein
MATPISRRMSGNYVENYSCKFNYDQLSPSSQPLDISTTDEPRAHHSRFSPYAFGLHMNVTFTLILQIIYIRALFTSKSDAELMPFISVADNARAKQTIFHRLSILLLLSSTRIMSTFYSGSQLFGCAIFIITLASVVTTCCSTIALITPSFCILFSL